MTTLPHSVSVVIPAFNEEHTIGGVLRAVLAQSVTEVICVDDGSTDGTADEVRKVLSCDNRVIYLKLPKNMGKGAALRHGIKIAGGEVIIFQDADMEYSPDCYPKLLEPILSGRADVVYGSRFLGSNAQRVLYYWHYLGNKLLTTMSNICTNLNMTDMETGAKAFRAETVKGIQLQERGFGIEPEITAKIAKLPIRIYEVPVDYHGRSYAEGKKIGWRDGVWAIICILKYNCAPK